MIVFDRLPNDDHLRPVTLIDWEILPEDDVPLFLVRLVLHVCMKAVGLVEMLQDH